jgi:hypothetical protein
VNIELEPRGKWIYVEAVKPDSGKIELPGLKTDRQGTPLQGQIRLYRVLKVGRGMMASDGTIVPHEVQAGDEIVLAGEAPICMPHPIVYGNEDRGFIEPQSICGIVTGREGNKLPKSPGPGIVAARAVPKELIHA